MDDWQVFVTRLRDGEPSACQRFWDQFGEAMKRLADRQIAPSMQRRVDAEDIVQSVCRTFFRRASDGEFLVEDESQLWRLLCAITVAKTRMHVRYHRQKRRDVRAERLIGSVDGDGQRTPPEPEDLSDRPDEIVAFTEQFRRLITQLDMREAQILDLTLQGIPNHEISARLQYSERSVRRIVSRIRERFEREMCILVD